MNANEMSSIQYECSQKTAEILSCEMLQTSVRKSSSGKTLKDEIEKGVESLKSEKPLKPEECDGMQKVLEAMRNPPNIDSAKEIRAMPVQAREDMAKWLVPFIEYCRNPTPQTMTKFVTANFDRDSRTCNVSGYRFSMNFKKVDDSVWASNSGPDGECGVITIARLEKSPENPSFWNYVQQRVITNPNASVLAGIPCSGFDRSEQRYVWRSKEKYAQCDYVKFSP